MKTFFARSVYFFLIAVITATASDSRDEGAEMTAKSEKELNTAYQHLIERIRREQPERAESIIEQLRRSQRAWLKFRDEQASFVGTYHEIGSASARADGLTDYTSELTRQRIKDFENVPDPF